MNKLVLLFLLLITALALPAQDSTLVPEPGYETSFTNTELWWVVLAGFLALVALYFLFRRRKR